MATSDDDDYDNDDGYYDLELYFTIIIYWPNLPYLLLKEVFT